MPKMFGDEKYAFSLVDIEDPRYVEEAALMGRKLTRLNYEKQIVDMEWTRTYKSLLRAEKRKQEIKAEIDDFKAHLLTLQEQKDMYESCIQDIWTRCHQIKESIRTENDLESLRKELSQRVQQQYAPDDEFWSTKFSLETVKGRREGREWELAIME